MGSRISELIKPIATLLLMPALIFSQGQQLKVIEWSKSPVNSQTRTATNLLSSDQIEGVEIEDISVESKSITIGHDFLAGDDWLQTITFRIKNISDQQLRAIQITVVLPEMSRGGPDIVFCYGCAKEEKEKGVSPGEEVDLKILGGPYYAWVQDKIASQGSISRIRRAEIRDMIATLPNGMKWFSGCVKTTDLRNACPHDAP